MCMSASLLHTFLVLLLLSWARQSLFASSFFLDLRDSFGRRSILPIDKKSAATAIGRPAVTAT